MITPKLKLVFTFILIILFNKVFGQSSQNSSIFYHQPAIDWSSQALPIGNGRMGAMFFGGVEKELYSSTSKACGQATTTGTANMKPAITALVLTGISVRSLLIFRIEMQ
jgi:hypothetical protein